MRLVIVIFCFALFGCFKAPRFNYQDSNNHYLLEIKESNNEGLIDTLYLLRDFDEKSTIREVGFYKNGFRNGRWNYNSEREVITIDWALYEDTLLHFRTSTFPKIDSIKRGENYTRMEFLVNKERINLTIKINRSTKGSMPATNYKELVDKELKNIGHTLVFFETDTFSNSKNAIYINRMKVRVRDGTYKYVKSCVAFLERDYLEFSVVTPRKEDFFADRLFDAVLTDLEYGGSKIYNPLSGSKLMRVY